MSWHFCNSAWYTSFRACNATFSYSRFCRSSLSNESDASFSPMTCRCFSWISSIFASNPSGIMSFRMCFLSALPLSFWEFTVSEMKISWSWASSLGVPYYGSPPPSAWRKARDLISSSDNLTVYVMIQAIPRYCPICALLNQFWSPLSTSTSISFRLNTSDSSLALETFSKEDIFIYGPFRP